LQIGLKIEKCSASDQNPLIWKSIARYNCPCFFDFLSRLPKCWKTDRRIMTSKIFQWKCQHEIGFYNIQSTAFSRPIWMLISLILEHQTYTFSRPIWKLILEHAKYPLNFQEQYESWFQNMQTTFSRAIWKFISEHANYILKSNMKVHFRTYNLVHIFKTNMKLILRTYKLNILKTKMKVDFRTYKVPHSQVQYEHWF